MSPYDFPDLAFIDIHGQPYGAIFDVAQVVSRIRRAIGGASYPYEFFTIRAINQ